MYVPVIFLYEYCAIWMSTDKLKMNAINPKATTKYRELQLIIQ